MQVLNRQRLCSPVPGSIEKLASAVLERLARPRAALSIALVGAGSIAALNRRYRGKSHPTDVLSFPLAGETFDGRTFLGDVIIAPRVATRNARRWGNSLEDELRKLVVHGILHLLGYDHETDRGEMERLEKRLLARREIAGIRLLAQGEQ